MQQPNVAVAHDRRFSVCLPSLSVLRFRVRQERLQESKIDIIVIVIDIIVIVTAIIIVIVIVIVIVIAIAIVLFIGKTEAYL